MKIKYTKHNHQHHHNLLYTLRLTLQVLRDNVPTSHSCLCLTLWLFIYLSLTSRLLSSSSS